MKYKSFGNVNYAIMPVDNINVCDDVFKSWIETAGIAHFPSRLAEVHNFILEVINNSTSDPSVNNDITSKLGDKSFDLGHQFDKSDPLAPRECVYIDTADFEVLIKISRKDGNADIAYKVCLEREGKKHTVVMAGGDDIDNLTIQSFIPGTWIDKFYALVDDLRLLKDCELMEKYEKMKAFKEEFADFGIFESDM